MNLHRLKSPIDRVGRNELNENFDRIERNYKTVIVDSTEAKQIARQSNTKSDVAVQTADAAKIKANATSKQLEDIIIESGLSDAEVVASRTDTETGETFTSLPQRLDVQHEKITAQLTHSVIETVGYGVVEGLLVEPQTWPIRNMTVQVSAGSIYMPSGKRYSFDATPTINIDAASPTLMRKDVIYVSDDGEIKLLKGTPMTDDSDVPTIPIGAVMLGIVTIKPEQTVIDTNVVLDKRPMLLSNNKLVDNLQTTRESNALSIRYSDGIITNLLNNAQTFVKNVDKFAYGTPTALADGQIYKDENGKFLLNCSTFGQLLMRGASYETTKYGGLPENVYDSSFNPNTPATDDMYTYDWAEWAYNAGFGFTPTNDLENLITGDIIFFSWKSVNAQLPKHHASFMNLDHTSIFIESNPDGSFIVYEDGHLPALATYPASYREQIVYACRLPLGHIDAETKNIVNNANNRIVSNGRTVVNTYNLNERLVNHKWYTVVIKGKILTSNCWFNIYCGSSLLYSGRLHGIRPDDLYTFHFCTKDLDLSANNLTINVVAESETSVPASSRSCIVEWVVMTPVYTNKIKEYVGGGNTVTFTFNSGYSGIAKIYYDGKTCTLNVRINNASNINDNALVDIGTITGVSMTTSSNIPATSMIALSVQPSYSNDVTAWVQTDEDGTTRLRLLNGSTQNRNFIDIAATLPIN